MDDEKLEETPQDMPEGEEVEAEGGEEQPSEEVDAETEQEMKEALNYDDLEPEVRSREEEKVEYGDDVDPEDIKVIGGIVEKQTASGKRQLQATQDKLEVDTFIQERPEFTKYRPAIVKYMQHPAYSQIPVKNIASMVAANELMQLGATKEREAQAKADGSKTKGSPARTPNAGQTDWKKAPKEDFEAQKRKVLGQG